MNIFLLIFLWIYFFVWVPLAFYNFKLASKKCDELAGDRVDYDKWYWQWDSDSVRIIFKYYSPFSYKNLFGLRSLFIPFKVPESSDQTWTGKYND